ncbi:MAG: hypothetical protein H7833_17620 [Magnetococcus sp. DMHC-1]|nr:hypothetical protein [Magnetococcales bacterium]
MNKHPIKEIRSAIEHAIDKGWKFDKASGHAFGILKCPTNKKCRNGVYCQFSVWSTPKDPEEHARAIRRAVDQCKEKR